MDPDFRKASCSSSNVIRVFWIGGNDVCSVAAAPSSALLRFRRRDDPARRPPRMVSVARGESSWSSMSVLQFTTPPSIIYIVCVSSSVIYGFLASPLSSILVWKVGFCQERKLVPLLSYCTGTVKFIVPSSNVLGMYYYCRNLVLLLVE